MFICTGNICRSAMAHYMLAKKAKEQNKDIEVYSCGVWAENGDSPTYEGISVMKDYGIDLSNHRATNIRNSKIEEMDPEFLQELNALTSQLKTDEEIYSGTWQGLPFL